MRTRSAGGTRGPCTCGTGNSVPLPVPPFNALSLNTLRQSGTTELENTYSPHTPHGSRGQQPSAPRFRCVQVRQFRDPEEHPNQNRPAATLRITQIPKENPMPLHARTHQDRLAALALGKSQLAVDAGLDARSFESNDRRGYLHGYRRAMDDLQRCRPSCWQRLCAFFDGPLMRWRYGDCDSMELPPSTSGSRSHAK